MALEIGAFPLGVPGPWTRLLHDDGADVLIQSGVADAVLFAAEALALSVEDGGGWAVVVGDLSDGAHADRPSVSADEVSDAAAQQCWTRVFLTHQVREVLDRAPSPA